MVTPIRPAEFILGKTLPFFLIGLFDVSLIAIVGTLWFQVPFRGQILVLFTGAILFLLCMLAERTGSLIVVGAAPSHCCWFTCCMGEVLMALLWILANTELGPRADPPSARSSCCVSQEVKGELHERDPVDRPRTSGVRIHRLRWDEVVRLRKVQSHASRASSFWKDPRAVGRLLGGGVHSSSSPLRSPCIVSRRSRLRS